MLRPYASPRLRSRLCQAVAVVLVLLATGCSSGGEVSLNEDPDDYQEQVAALQEQIAERPEEAALRRDLGVIYVRTGRRNQGYDELKKAYQLGAEDPKTIYFLGLASEGVGNVDEARTLFQRYGDVPQDSRYRDLMEGRYTYLVREEARKNAQRLLAQEAEIADREVDARTVAVLPLEHSGSNDKYARLGRGLAEMILTDLTKVRELRLVERVRLQAILDELELAQSEYVDPSTAPRVGKLLGAGRVVGGSYLVTSDERVRMDLTIAQVTGEREGPEVGTQVGSLSDLFRLQTQLVYQIVNAFGIELTPQEREAIEPVPTQSLQAFLAYSEGLWEEDRGNFGAAAERYREAARLDPGFDAARQAQTRSNGLSSASGSLRNAVAAGVQGRIGGGQTASGLVQRRIQRMTGFRGGGPLQERRENGEDRNLNEDVTRSEEILPLPPNPPSTEPPDGQ